MWKRDMDKTSWILVYECLIKKNNSVNMEREGERRMEETKEVKERGRGDKKIEKEREEKIKKEKEGILLMRKLMKRL